MKRTFEGPLFALRRSLFAIGFLLFANPAHLD
jgi:hypothetical protein